MIISEYLIYIVASELKDPIWHSLEWQIGSFSSEATTFQFRTASPENTHLGIFKFDLFDYFFMAWA